MRPVIIYQNPKLKLKILIKTNLGIYFRNCWLPAINLTLSGIILAIACLLTFYLFRYYVFVSSKYQKKCDILQFLHRYGQDIWIEKDKGKRSIRDIPG